MTHRMRELAIPATVAILALALGVGIAAWDRKPPDAGPLLALSLPDMEGQPQPLRQWQGKVMVINFWATWCEPCRQEMPEFVRAQRELGPKGVQFVGIAVDQRDKIAQFANELDLNYPVLVGGFDAVDISKTLGNPLAALPFTVILGRDGRVAHTQLGQLKPIQLRSIIANLL